MKVERRTAQDMVYCMDRPGDRYETGNLLFELVREEVREELFDTSRWSIIYMRIYKELTSEKFYQTFYSIGAIQTGATEIENVLPYEHEDDFVNFEEVLRVPVQT